MYIREMYVNSGGFLKMNPIKKVTNMACRASIDNYILEVVDNI